MKKWLYLAVFSLAIAGLCSLPPAILRGPFFEHMFNTQYIFDISLVVHVNLSVLIWFLALIGLVWSIHTPLKLLWLANIGYYLCFIGTILLILPLFSSHANPLKSNYIPMLYHPLFALGLALIFNAFLLLGILQIFIPARLETIPLTTTAVIMIIALLTFFLSGLKLMHEAPGEDPLYFFESLYNGGGHLLQFAYTNLMMLAWLWLSNIKKIPLLIGKNTVALLFIANAIFTLPAPGFLIINDEVEQSFYYFTQHMRYVGSIAPMLFGLTIIASMLFDKRNNAKSPRYLGISLIFSILFFAYGGILALQITGMNTIVPAHYHASVVGGISIACIGLIYHLLPKMGLMLVWFIIVFLI